MSRVEDLNEMRSELKELKERRDNAETKKEREELTGMIQGFEDALAQSEEASDYPTDIPVWIKAGEDIVENNVELFSHHFGVKDYMDGEDIAPFYMPEDENGFVFKKKAWERFKELVDAFYDGIIEEKIDTYNEENLQRLEHNARLRDWINDGNKGYIYLLEGREYYKIGRSVEPKKRTNTLQIQLPFEVNLKSTVFSYHYKELEKSLHKKFEDKNTNGEWFELSNKDIEFIESLGGEESVEEQQELISKFYPDS